MFLTCREAILRLATKLGEADAVLKLSFGDDRNPCKVEGEAERRARSHYFLGRSSEGWIPDVRSYGRVHYQSVHPGVDLVFYGNQQRPEYDFVLEAGADPSVIRLTIDGADRLTIDEEGRLVALDRRRASGPTPAGRLPGWSDGRRR